MVVILYIGSLVGQYLQCLSSDSSSALHRPVVHYIFFVDGGAVAGISVANNSGHAHRTVLFLNMLIIRQQQLFYRRIIVVDIWYGIWLPLNGGKMKPKIIEILTHNDIVENSE